MDTNDNPLDSIPKNEWDRLIISIVKPFYPLCRKDSTLSPEDLQQEAWIALLKACERYDPNKAKITTFAYHYIRGSVMGYIAKHTKNKLDQSDEDPADLEHKTYTDESVETTDLMRTMLEMVEHEEHADLLREHFINNKSFRQIAKARGVSHETIANRIHKLLDMLQIRLKHVNLH